VFQEGEDRLGLWDRPAFVGLSIVHKLTAAPYYLVLMDAVHRLAQPRWFDKHYWVAQFQA
jgi:hypothetical protein